MGSTLSLVAASGADLLFPSYKSFEIMVVGLDNAGKTCLLHRFKHQDISLGVLPETTPTTGSNEDTISYGSTRITIVEHSGNPRTRPLWRCSFLNAFSFVFVLDAATPERFSEAKTELQLLYDHRALHSHPLLVLANKIDLPGAADLHTISKALDIDALSQSGKTIAIKAVSAMTGEGIDEVMQWFVANISHGLIARHNNQKAEDKGVRDSYFKYY
ncbi:ADP-ribosylation factor family-domain-containing protein [Mycena vulgaris]|nr:ADP-ribosylation factor family-domain-containing protein [Mycena vulgaris]